MQRAKSSKCTFDELDFSMIIEFIGLDMMNVNESFQPSNWYVFE